VPFLLWALTYAREYHPRGALTAAEPFAPPWRQNQMHGLSASTSGTSDRTPVRAGSAWRRVWAFFLDLALVGTAARFAGDALFEPMSNLGELGRLIGWALVVAYFGTFDSRWGGGRSIGKRLLGLRVIRPDGTSISPLVASARASLLTLPILFNGMPTGTSYVTAPIFFNAMAMSSDPLLMALLNLAVMGLGVAIVYMAAFNCVLHDLAFGTLVVCSRDLGQQRRLAAAAPVWRGHLVVVGLILLASFLYPLVEPDLAGTDEIDAIRSDVARLPLAGSVAVEILPRPRSFSSEFFSAETETPPCDEDEPVSRRDGARQRTKLVRVTVALQHVPADRHAALREVVDAAFARHQAYFADKALCVKLVRGFNFGIVRHTKRIGELQTSAAQWRQ
jgi:uncharacterized RDD family membrane protein YckC